MLSLTVAMFQLVSGVSRGPLPQLYSLLNPLHLVLQATLHCSHLGETGKDSILLIQRSFSPLHGSIWHGWSITVSTAIQECHTLLASFHPQKLFLFSVFVGSSASRLLTDEDPLQHLHVFSFQPLFTFWGSSTRPLSISSKRPRSYLWLVFTQKSTASNNAWDTTSTY